MSKYEDSNRAISEADDLWRREQGINKVNPAKVLSGIVGAAGGGFVIGALNSNTPEGAVVGGALGGVLVTAGLITWFEDRKNRREQVKRQEVVNIRRRSAEARHQYKANFPIYEVEEKQGRTR